MINAILLVLGSVSALALLPTFFLVLNTISALLIQQVRQVGIMKALGAFAHQIVEIYIAFVVLIGLLAVATALPLSIVPARAFSAYMAGILNFDQTISTFPAHILIFEIAIGVGLTVATDVLQVAADCRITIREAISSCGIFSGRRETRHSQPSPSSSCSARIISIPQFLFSYLQSRALPRLVLLSFHYSLRRRVRLTFTLVPLIFAGALAISVMSMHSSLLLSLDELAGFWKYDIGLDLAERQQIDRIRVKAERAKGRENASLAKCICCASAIR